MNIIVTDRDLVKIKLIEKITPDVLRIVTAKPAGFQFVPGQAIDIAVNKTGWQEERRPFSFTSLPGNDYLEFTIKTYPSRKGVTNELLKLKKDDTLILYEVFGEISYKGEGVFIAGGAGITPFLSIFRFLETKKQIGNNMLVYANKTKDDIIHNMEFKKLLGHHFINILSDEKVAGYSHGMISEYFLRTRIVDFDKRFYVCGPPPMMDAVLVQLANLGVDESLVTMEAI